jgi:hypothetical protein
MHPAAMDGAASLRTNTSRNFGGRREPEYGGYTMKASTVRTSLRVDESSKHIFVGRDVLPNLARTAGMKWDSTVEDWSSDPIVVAAARGETRYSTLFAAQTWLPVDFDFAFRSEWVTGDEMVYGSATQFTRELDDLNSQTFRLSVQDLLACRHEGKEKDETLEKGAKFALSLFSDMANRAISYRLVMMLDY